MGQELPERYSVLRKLGAGGMGNVVLAHDHRLDRAVAVKVGHPGGDRPVPDQDVRMWREARLHARVCHPHVVPILDVGLFQGRPYLVLEPLEGTSLGRARCTPAQLARTLVPILGALGAIHQEGLLHRDLNPGNIFLDRTRGPVLIDFGLAQDQDPDATRLTAAGLFVGAPIFAAPESLVRGEYSVRSDLHSLARVFAHALLGPTYEAVMVCGAHRSFGEFMDALEAGRYMPKARQALAPHGRLGAALLAALDPDPTRRPASAEAMLAILRGTGSQDRSGHQAPPRTAGGAVAPAQPAAAEPSRSGRLSTVLAMAMILLAGFAGGRAAMSGLPGAGIGGDHGSRTTRAL